MIELIIVILVIGALSSLVYIRSPDETVNLTGQLQRIAAGIRYAQTLSMTRAQRFRIDFTRIGYRITECFYVTDINQNLASASLPNGMLLSSNRNSIVFNGLGVPYSACLTTQPMTTPVVITLSKAGDSQQLTVAQETGRVVLG